MSSVNTGYLLDPCPTTRLNPTTHLTQCHLTGKKASLSDSQFGVGTGSGCSLPPCTGGACFGRASSPASSGVTLCVLTFVCVSQAVWAPIGWRLWEQFETWRFKLRLEQGAREDWGGKGTFSLVSYRAPRWLRFCTL